MPACARGELVRNGEVGTYHCVQRCVRRAFLCGADAVTGRSFEHRRGWVRARIIDLAGSFAVEMCSYSVMENHLHVIVRTRPDLAGAWTHEEVARRWWSIFTGCRDEDGRPAEPTAADPAGVPGRRGGGGKWLSEVRERLSCLSWFMRCLAEPIARRANKEDRCTGRFWEGRFKCQALLDEEAVLACSVYVDLNPIRAGIAATPESSAFTSAQDRCAARQAHYKLAALADHSVRSADAAPSALISEARAELARDRWLCPLGGDDSHLPSIDLDRYLELLDWSGRQVHANKRGAIPDHLRPIIERLAIDVDRWIDTVTRFGRWFRRAAGKAPSMAAEALRAGRRWLHGIDRARVVFASSA